MDKRKRKKLAPVICAGIVIAVLLVYLMITLYPLLLGIGDLMAIFVLLIGALGLLAVIGGVILALRQRLAEIEDGEEEEAKKY